MQSFPFSTNFKAPPPLFLYYPGYLMFLTGSVATGCVAFKLHEAFRLLGGGEI